MRSDHPPRRVRAFADVALEALSAEFAALYPPQLSRLSIPSERQLMERLDFDLLFRRFVGLDVSYSA